MYNWYLRVYRDFNAGVKRIRKWNRASKMAMWSSWRLHPCCREVQAGNRLHELAPRFVCIVLLFCSNQLIVLKSAVETELTPAELTIGG